MAASLILLTIAMLVLLLVRQHRADRDRQRFQAETRELGACHTRMLAALQKQESSQSNAWLDPEVSAQASRPAAPTRGLEGPLTDPMQGTSAFDLPTHAASHRQLRQVSVATGPRDLRTRWAEACARLGTAPENRLRFHDDPILVLDAEGDFQVVLLQCLSSLGYVAEGAQSAAAALELAKTRGYAVVLAGEQVPGSMSGLDLIQAFREVDPKAFGLLMASHPTTMTIGVALKAGAYDCLRKPFQVAELDACVWRTLDHHQALRERAADVAPLAPPPPVAQDGARAPGRILLVDHETDHREFLLEALNTLGHATEAVDSAEAAIALAKTTPYAVILTRNLMPGGLSGLDLIGAIRGMDSGTFCILMTLYSSSEFAVQALEQGAYQVIVIPFSLAALDASLTRALDHHQALYVIG